MWFLSNTVAYLPDDVKHKNRFFVENIHSVLPRLAEAYFYRTAAGAEIDLVIKMPNTDVWAVEIKHGHAPKISKHYSRTCDDVGATHKFIVYGGDDEFHIGDNVRMISLPGIMEKLACGPIMMFALI